MVITPIVVIPPIPVILFILVIPPRYISGITHTSDTIIVSLIPLIPVISPIQFNFD